MDNALPSVARCSALISAFVVALMLGGCVGNTETTRSATCLDRLPATPAAFDAEAAEWIDTLEFDGGLHVQGGTLYAFDRYDSRVTAVDMQQRVVWQSGRRGDGPLELSPRAVGERLWPMNARWLHATGDTIAVFDGRRVLLLEHGAPRRQLVVPATWLSGLVRVHALHWFDERTLVLVIETGPELFGRVEDSQRLELVRLPLDGSEPTLLLSLPTPAWPRNLAGMPVRGLGEAGPTVAVRSRCLIVSDGHSDSIHVIDPLRGENVAVRLALPKRFADAPSPDDQRRLGLSVDHAAPVRYPARIRALAIAPDGQLLMIPDKQLHEGEVWRIPRGQLAPVSDTLSEREARIRFALH